MRQTGVPFPITSYVIPPAAPAEVAEAWRELHRVGSLVEDCKDDLSDAKEAVNAAKAKDVQAIVRATNEGTEVKDPQANERKALAEVSRLGSMLRGLQQAADEAGNALARQIDQHRDEWQTSLVELREAAAARYDAAIAEAKAALSELIPAQAGVTWVEDFHLGQARTGQYTSFAGGRLRVSGRGQGVSDLRKDTAPRICSPSLVSPPPSRSRGRSSVSRPIQRTHAELQHAPPEVVSKWLRAGELEDLLSGRDPGTPAGSEPAPDPTPAPRPDAADQGARARTGIEQVTETELRFMSPSQIVAARKAERLADLGVAP